MNVITLKMGMYLMFFTFLFYHYCGFSQSLLVQRIGKTGSGGNEYCINKLIFNKYNIEAVGCNDVWEGRT